MLFPTVDFAIFFSVVLFASWSTPAFSQRWKVLILASSYVFYGWWDVRFTLLLAGVTCATQVAALGLSRTRGRLRVTILAAGITANVGLLAWFKYAGFFASSLVNAAATIGLHPPLPLLQMALPVGISFFTFQAISYLVDVHRTTIPVGGWLDVAVFLSFFPHVVAGPIVRAIEFLPQLRRTRMERRIDATRAAWLIVAGLGKKVVLASFLQTAIVDPVFAQPRGHSGIETLVGVYGYAVQIWADFSGYTDIAIGCALLLGIRFPANFSSPYAATSLQDFWRRWHMTLSRWLRDYVYIPLGGSRGGERRAARNLMLTMLIGGLWHGAAWTFVIWGALHGIMQVAERQVRAHRVRTGMPRVPFEATLARVATFHAVCFAWIFFRADSVGDALTVLGRIATGGLALGVVTPAVLAAIALGIGVQYVPADIGARAVALGSRAAPALQGAGIAACLAVIGAFGPQGVAPFIYYRF